jgi:hypothetical protein
LGLGKQIKGAREICRLEIYIIVLNTIRFCDIILKNGAYELFENKHDGVIKVAVEC